MPFAAVSEGPHPNLVKAGKLNKNLRKEVEGIAARIKNLNETQDAQRTGIRQTKGDTFRFDVKRLNEAGGGAQNGDYKLEIQTNGKSSVTYGIVFISGAATNSSLNDLNAAIAATVTDQFYYRVT